jgi:lysophospholipid acyltransferase (LPLAT)-like uncharacterized protein
MSEAASTGPAQTDSPGFAEPPRSGRRPARWWKRFVIRHVAPEAAYVVLTLLRASWRVRETGREHFDRVVASGRSPVVAFLHGRAMMLLNTVRGRRRGRWLSMCSKSLDGDGMTKLEERLGFGVIRGSSGRDGLQAIIDMIRIMRDRPGVGACLAVDGSRGPRGVVQGGIVSLAQRTGGVIVPVTIAANPAWIFRKAWDRTLLALPFARVEVVFGEPFEVPAKMRAPEFTRLCTELEDRFAALQAQADRQSGFGDPEPVKARA